jgi:hypothetical protein
MTADLKAEVVDASKEAPLPANAQGDTCDAWWQHILLAIQHTLPAGVHMAYVAVCRLCLVSRSCICDQQHRALYQLSTAQLWLVRTICENGNWQHCAGFRVVGAFGAFIVTTNLLSLHVRLAREHEGLSARA